MDIPFSFGLDGKVAIVAGGGAAGDGIGNGRAVAILMAKAGAHVLVADRELSLAERTVAMVTDAGGTAAAFAGDLTRDADCAAMVAEAVDRFGRLDVLDNNIGIVSTGSVVEESEANWDKLMTVNVKPMFLASKHAISAMIESGGGGAIVNISSILSATSARADCLRHDQGCGDRADPRHGGRSCHPRHSGQLRGAGTGLHPDGLCRRHERRGP